MGTLTESLSGMLLLPLVVSTLLAGLAQSNENYEENGMEYNLPVALEGIAEEEGMVQRRQVWNRNAGRGGKGKAGRGGKVGGGEKDKRKRMARKNGRRVQNKMMNSRRGRGQRWGKRRSWRKRNGKGKR